MKSALAGEPPAFPLKSQYVKTVAAARDAAGLEPAPCEGGDGESKGSGSSSKKRPADLEGEGGEGQWNYNKVRLSYINRVKKENKISFQDAQNMWDESPEKKNLLKDVSVKELKRRKFLPKGATENPWAK